MDKTNRIFFTGNPFPKGHRVKTFVWNGELEPEKGLVFHFHLETEDYNAEDEGSDAEAEELPDWLSKAVWNNYHKCTLSSKAYRQEGIVVAKAGQLFDFGTLSELTLSANPLPLAEDWDPDDLAFGIYLLGHDSCAGHEIRVTRTGEDCFTIYWTGKIALSYAGEDAFNYEFEAYLDKVRFDGIYYPKAYTQEQAMALLASLVTDPQQYVFEDLNPKSFKRAYKLIRATNGL